MRKKETFDLPLWVPRDAWSGYIQMRKLIKKPMSPYAQELALKKLTELQAQGYSATAVLEQSIFNCWQGLFPIKEQTHGTQRRNDDPNERLRQATVTLGTIQKWLTRFAALYSFIPNGAIPNLWMESLGDLLETAFVAACVSLEKTFIPTAASPFPTPGHIRSQMAPVIEASKVLEADEKWQWLIRNLNWGVGRHEMGDRTYRAACAAGGLGYLESCPESELQWAKKRFVEAYEALVTIEENQEFLTDAEAKKFLRQHTGELKQ